MGEGCIGWLFIIASCVCLWLLSSICSRESYELGWAALKSKDNGVVEFSTRLD